MKVSDIIVILLFIIPGVIAEKISYSMDLPSSEKRSEFRELVTGIMLSLPIIAIVGFVICIINGYSSVSCFSTAFDDIWNLLLFTILSVVLAIVLGIVKGLSNDWFSEKINNIREKGGKIQIDGKSCWRKLFLDDPNCHFVEIIKDGRTHLGFTKWYSLPNEDKEIVLYELPFHKENPHYRSYIKKVDHTYVNIEKNIVIIDYDLTDYNHWIDSGCPDKQPDITP